MRKEYLTSKECWTSKECLAHTEDLAGREGIFDWDGMFVRLFVTKIRSQSNIPSLLTDM